MEKVKKIRNKKNLIKVIIIAVMFITWVCFSFTPKVMFDNKTVQLWVNTPNYALLNQDFTITVEAWDWSERLAKAYKGTVEFSLISYDINTYDEIDNVDASLPEPTKFKGTFMEFGGLNPKLFGGDVGIMSFNLSINTEGIHYIAVKDDKGFSAISNPVIVSNDTKMLLWGDIHTHSALSDGSGSPDTNMKYARDNALLDFYALVDHGEGFGVTPAERAQWEINYSFKKTEKYNDPGDFVTFHGIEWTTSFGQVGKEWGYGHYAIVSDAAAPVLAARGKQKSPAELWAYLDEYTAANNAQVIAIPHHLTQTAFEMDWFGANPKYVKIVEVLSVHGASLLQPDDVLNLLGNVHVTHTPTPGAAAADALKMGYKVAFVADSDSHDGHPGHTISHRATHYPDQYPMFSFSARYGHPYAGGLTGVYIDSDGFTRQGIMQGIRNGSVVATRQPFRPIIDFSVNGSRPGENSSTISVPLSTSERTIRVQVIRDGLELGWDGQAAINEWDDLTVEIWKNSELWRTQKINTPIADITVTDDSEITGTSYEDYYYNEADGKYYENERSLIGIDDPSGLNTGGEDYYFVRIYQGEGTKADFYGWVGPIWVGVSD